ncbi:MULTISPECIES: TetR/AcrR family transcriptional regulator [Lentibacter]|jgi:AcrR family transcriptional regulator|uniref:Transcriptional regulator, TetR family n=1 Tax=Lentibacter algarum TaxID=576131 RepID=A0A1H3M527_9RHOB|nr:TetR/AcrR family transcriptional regulator [Lentibacter algarum]MCO4776884.1 TetR/AcrR family transcriptional regulator [Lentibacter algarum]MCO4826869.1 TetR/AcrR family transcriptional regulator [Lentibacter algarum]WIF32907.1 transcriptional regulator, TetR family [Lentibacter algarum]SDY71309.1 transcriptional regulator, TetR family [Lentibacter algarum]
MSVHTSTASPKGRKYEDVLGGAREIFLRDGFEGASVDDIARAAGVSKATLYSYFSDKRELFREVTRVECERMAETTLARIDFNAPPREVFTTAAHSLTRFLLSNFSLQMFRTCVAEAARFPELGQAFYQNGPEMGRARMVVYLKLAIERGQLHDVDPDMIAEQFSELCRARLWSRAIFGVQTSFSEVEIDEVANHAVETVLARFAV